MDIDHGREHLHLVMRLFIEGDCSFCMVRRGTPPYLSALVLHNRILGEHHHACRSDFQEWPKTG